MAIFPNSARFPSIAGSKGSGSELVPIHVTDWASKGFYNGYILITYNSGLGDFIVAHVRSTLLGSTSQIHYQGRDWKCMLAAFEASLESLEQEGFFFNLPVSPPRDTWYEFINKQFPSNPALYRPLLAA